MGIWGAGTLKYISKKEIPMNPVANWNDFWDKTVLRGDTRARVIAKFVEAGSSVLDIGCGDGTLLAELKRLVPRIHELGVDISDVAVEKALEKGIQARVLDVVIEKDYLDELGQFDYVILAEVLEHVREAEELLTSAARIARRAILVTIPNAGHIRHRLRLLFGRFPVVLVTHHISEHIRFWTLKDFLWWSESLGLQVQHYLSVYGTTKLDLHRRAPGLFSDQLLFVLKAVHGPCC